MSYVRVCYICYCLLMANGFQSSSTLFFFVFLLNYHACCIIDAIHRVGSSKAITAVYPALLLNIPGTFVAYPFLFFFPRSANYRNYFVLFIDHFVA